MKIYYYLYLKPKLNWNFLTSFGGWSKNFINFNIGFIDHFHQYFGNRGIKSPMQLYCIIQQQALCGIFLGADSFMSFVISVVKFIPKSGLRSIIVNSKVFLKFSKPSSAIFVRRWSRKCIKTIFGS